uniref:F-box domain-containing protein n=1 Tax=Leersia perrieri TaxID=77586 RepID=A0A0D9W320_9ORYZ
MELGSTRKCSRARGGGGLAVDRLSELPDCLLHIILSFMKARQVVQTCVLSKRWEHLWRTVPCLDVDHEEFPETGSTIQDEYKAWHNFEDFVDNLLLSHEIARLDSFRLHVNNVNRSYMYGYGWGLHASRWIRRSIKYSSKVDAWTLRRLHLSHIYLDDLFAKHIGSGCPSLEDLDIKRCTFALDEISSNSLKSLVINDCHSTRHHTKLIVKAPATASLRLALNLYYFTGGLFVTEMPSLSAASVSVLDNPKGTFHHNRWEFIVSLCNVTTLVLSDFQT